MDIKSVYDKLFAYAEARNFAGYDPFDGLNSAYFQATPLKYLAPARLAWLQMVKRSAKNLRPLLKVPEEVNPKGIALFALAELSRFRATNDEKHKANAGRLLEWLNSLKIRVSDSKSAFGYNFDWQSRAFFAPVGTPTVVPTAFACQAFLEAYQIFGNENYLNTAREICRFIVEDLNRPIVSAGAICFSYTPIDKSVIFNASLLAAECLTTVGDIDENREYLELAGKAATLVFSYQEENGSWAYGPKLRHKWVDNFHTVYILLSLYRLQKIIPNLNQPVSRAMQTGFKFWVDNFFLEDGAPKYFDKETFPIDIHSASAAIVGLADLNEYDQSALPLAEKVAEWTIVNMRDEEGYFYYQKTKSGVIKTPFMRWGQAWMAYALARLLEAKNK